MTTRQEQLRQEQLRREVEKRQQQQAQPPVQPQQPPQDIPAREQMALTGLQQGGAVKTAIGHGQAIQRGVEQVPEAVQQTTGLSKFVDVAGNTASMLGQAMSPFGMTNAPQQTNVTQRVERPPQGQPQSHAEQALKDATFGTSVVEAAPPVAASLMVSGGPAAGYLKKMLWSGTEGAATGQLVLGDDASFTDRVVRGAKDFGITATMRGVLEPVAALVKPLGKFLPSTESGAVRKAVREVNKWVNLKPERLNDLIAQSNKLFAEKAEDFGLAELLPEAQSKVLRNIEKEFAAESGPETGRKVVERQLRKEQQLTDAVDSFTDTMSLSAKEQDMVKEAYSHLNSLSVDPNRYEAIVKNPKFEELMEETFTKKLKHTADLRRQLEPFDWDSVAFLDTVKRHVQKRLYRGGLSGDVDFSDAEERALSELQAMLISATEEAAGGNSTFVFAKSLSQRKIIGEEIADMLAKAPEERVALGEFRTSVQGLNQVFNRRNWDNIQDALKGMKDPATRDAALHNANVIRELTKSVSESGKVAGRVGQTESATTDIAGVVSTTARNLGDFARGKYNEAIVEVLHNPVKYQKELAQLQKSNKSRKELNEALVVWLSQVTHKMLAEDEQRRVNDQRLNQ